MQGASSEPERRLRPKRRPEQETSNAEPSTQQPSIPPPPPLAREDLEAQTNALILAYLRGKGLSINGRLPLPKRISWDGRQYEASLEEICSLHQFSPNHLPDLLEHLLRIESEKRPHVSLLGTANMSIIRPPKLTAASSAAPASGATTVVPPQHHSFFSSSNTLHARVLQNPLSLHHCILGTQIGRSIPGNVLTRPYAYFRKV